MHITIGKFGKLSPKVQYFNFNITKKIEESDKYLCNQNPETLKFSEQEVFNALLSNVAKNCVVVATWLGASTRVVANVLIVAIVIIDDGWAMAIASTRLVSISICSY